MIFCDGRPHLDRRGHLPDPRSALAQALRLIGGRTMASPDGTTDGSDYLEYLVAGRGVACGCFVEEDQGDGRRGVSHCPCRRRRRRPCTGQRPRGTRGLQRTNTTPAPAPGTAAGNGKKCEQGSGDGCRGRGEGPESSGGYGHRRPRCLGSWVVRVCEPGEEEVRRGGDRSVHIACSAGSLCSRLTLCLS